METADPKTKIRRLAKSELAEFRELIDLFHEVFETKGPAQADEAYLPQLLHNPGFIAFAIIHNGVVVGGATAYALPMYDTRSTELFIYDVAVRTEYQRNGLGAKLISALKEYCLQNNIGEMFVPAHEQDIHALRFYESTGGMAEKVVHFNYKIS